MEENEKSYFDGGLLQLIGWQILGWLITFCTLGICYPWAFTMIYNWETKHTVINGKRLKFDGTAVQLFGNWIKWLLLTIITFGIYGLWLPIKLKKWKTKHTSFVINNSIENAAVKNYETITTENQSETIQNNKTNNESSTNISSNGTTLSSQTKNIIGFAVIPFCITFLLRIIVEFLPFGIPIFRYFQFFHLGHFRFGIDTYTIIAIISIAIIAMIKKLSMKESLILGIAASVGYLPLLDCIPWGILIAVKYGHPFRWAVLNLLNVTRWISFIFYAVIIMGCSAGVGVIVKKLNENTVNKQIQ